MTLPVIFGPLTAASMGQLDQNFAAVGALTVIQCTATGTNSIVLTPSANQPTVNGYGLPNPLKFGFTAPASSTGSVTLEINALGFLPVYTQNGVQATSGTLISGNYYEVTYTTGAIYNSGSGAWVLSSYQAATGVAAITAPAVSGLSISNNAGTPTTQIDVSFGRSCLVSAVGAPAFVGSGAFTINLTTGTVTPAANGMDGTSRPASGWVYLYAISTGSGAAGLGSLVSPLSGAPALPAGYSFYAYLGAMRCDGSSNLLSSKQKGSRAQYSPQASGNTTIMPAIIATASAAITVWTATAISTFVPTTASCIAMSVYSDMQAGGAMSIAANGNAPSAITGGVFYNNGQSFSTNVPIEMELESSNIYLGVTGGVNAYKIFALGWTDYVSAAGG